MIFYILISKKRLFTACFWIFFRIFTGIRPNHNGSPCRPDDGVAGICLDRLFHPHNNAEESHFKDRISELLTTILSRRPENFVMKKLGKLGSEEISFRKM